MEKGQQNSLDKTRKGYIGFGFMELIGDFDLNNINGVGRKLD